MTRVELTGYRGYTITNDAYGWRFCHNDYNGPPDSRCGSGQSCRDCMNWIDDYIANDIFCETCDSTGHVSTEDSKYGDDCPHCHDARECQGNNVNFPDVCFICQSPMSETWRGSGKENMRCFRCEPLKLS